jgi:hypothetical protein
VGQHKCANSGIRLLLSLESNSCYQITSEKLNEARPDGRAPENGGVGGDDGERTFELVGPNFDLARLGGVARTRHLYTALDFPERHRANSQARLRYRIQPSGHGAVRPDAKEFRDDVGVEQEHV